MNQPTQVWPTPWPGGCTMRLEPDGRRKQLTHTLHNPGCPTDQGLPSRWLRIHPTAGGVSKPNGILRQEAGPVRNTQGTGAEQVLNRPSSHEPTGGTSKPLTPETE